MKAIPCPIPPAELRRLYLEEKLTDEQIVDRIGEGATLKRVRSWRKQFDTPTLNRSARHDVPPVEGPLQSLLVGSMLGDGRVARNPHTARYIENHTENQRDYLEWKRQQWGSWSKNELSPVSWTHKGKTYPGWRFETVSHASLLPWHDLFYPVPGPKRLQEKVVDLVDPFAFAVWYLDDGHARWWPIITFGMDLASRGIAWGIFEKLGFTPRWYLHQGKTGEFIFEGEEQTERFIRFVEPHVPECMKHKLQFGFQGRYYEIRQTAPEDKLREMAAEGVPIKRMAQMLGLSASVVDRRLTKLGIDHPRTVGRPRG
jgi:hypothetical protein